MKTIYSKQVKKFVFSFDKHSNTYIGFEIMRIGNMYSILFGFFKHQISLAWFV
jgi:hypothetical protein